MKVLYWSIGLFIIGLLEFWIDQHQKVVLSRLKLWQSVIFQLLNQYFTFFVNVYAFGIIMDFWNQVKSGVYDATTLFPYLSYIHGCIAGTAVALLVYIRNKKKTDKDRAVNLLANSKSTKKKKGKKKSRKTTTTEVAQLFDSVEASDIKDEVRAAAIEKSSDIIAEKIENAFNE